MALIYAIESTFLKTNLSTGISSTLIMGLIGKDIFFDIREDDAFEVFHLPLFAWNSKFSKSSNSISPHKINDINSLKETRIWLFDFDWCRSLRIQYFRTKVDGHGPWVTGQNWRYLSKLSPYLFEKRIRWIWLFLCFFQLFGADLILIHEFERYQGRNARLPSVKSWVYLQYQIAIQMLNRKAYVLSSHVTDLNGGQDAGFDEFYLCEQTSL